MIIIERDEINNIDLFLRFGIEQKKNWWSFLFFVAGGIHTLSSRGNSEKRHDSQEKLTDYQSPMASSSRGTGSEDNDSDFDNQSHEDEIDNDDEQIHNRKQTEDLINQQEEQQKQLIVIRKKNLFFFFIYFI